MRKYVFVITDKLLGLHEECIEAGGMYEAFTKVNRLAKERYIEWNIQLKGVIY
ncbi:hypothetical protein [Bacillus solimangrovi]|uniref:hypothetical protein n=1 Tax=Bacillus solimangrovi TaxID=1305675 RepID=UPI001585D6D6|nr:hypothetical protein [Bacillus solimangrovi]